MGAGVAGMSAAWYLHEFAFDVTVYEKNDRIGGDVRTIDVMVDGETRWIDQGVNDFNAKTYRNLVQIFDELGVEYRRLEDTISMGTLDGSLVYTVDGKWGTAMPEAIRRDLDRFQRHAPEVLTNPTYRYMLVKDYVEERGFSDEFVGHYLYPRINGMYFTDRHGAGHTPIWPLVNYCCLQEGLRSRPIEWCKSTSSC